MGLTEIVFHFQRCARLFSGQFSDWKCDLHHEAVAEDIHLADAHHCTRLSYSFNPLKGMNKGRDNYYSGKVFFYTVQKLALYYVIVM